MHLGHADLAVLAGVGVALEVDREHMSFKRRRAVLLVVTERAAVRAARLHHHEVTHGRCPVIQALAVYHFLNLDFTHIQIQGDGIGLVLQYLSNYLKEHTYK